MGRRVSALPVAHLVVNSPRRNHEVVKGSSQEVHAVSDAPRGVGYGVLEGEGVVGGGVGVDVDDVVGQPDGYGGIFREEGDIPN